MEIGMERYLLFFVIFHQVLLAFFQGYQSNFPKIISPHLSRASFSQVQMDIHFKAVKPALKTPYSSGHLSCRNQKWWLSKIRSLFNRSLYFTMTLQSKDHSWAFSVTHQSVSLRAIIPSNVNPQDSFPPSSSSA